jgi:transposase
LCFCEDITAAAAAKLVKVNRKTVNNYYNDLREKILEETLKETLRVTANVNVTNRIFGARRVRWKRGQGAAEKIPVFGLLKHGGRFS